MRFKNVKFISMIAMLILLLIIIIVSLFTEPPANTTEDESSTYKSSPFLLPAMPATPEAREKGSEPGAKVPGS